MKKLFSLTILGLLFMSGMIPMISAEDETPDETPIYVSGKILYNGDINDPVEGAIVRVGCQDFVIETNSSEDGSYEVVFFYSEEYSCPECENGAYVYVEADKGDLFGEDFGIVEDYSAYIDVSIVSFPAVPEFGLFVGILTILSAVGIFFVIRRD